MKSIICLIVSLWSCYLLQAQPKECCKWAFDLTVGYQRTLQDWRSGSHADALLISQNNMFCFDWRVNYYFSDWWGIHGGIGTAFGKQSDHHTDQIPDEIRSVYEKQFFIRYPVLKKVDNCKPKFYMGIQTRFYRQKWAVLSRLSFGFSPIGADKCDFYLKGKGTNALYHNEYAVKGNASYRPKRMFLSPAVQLGYKWHNIYLMLEAGYVQYLQKITYVFSSTEIYEEGTVEVKEYRSRHLPNDLILNVGCHIPF